MCACGWFVRAIAAADSERAQTAARVAAPQSTRSPPCVLAPCAVSNQSGNEWSAMEKVQAPLATDSSHFTSTLRSMPAPQASTFATRPSRARDWLRFLPVLHADAEVGIKDRAPRCRLLAHRFIRFNLLNTVAALRAFLRMDCEAEQITIVSIEPSSPMMVRSARLGRTC